MSLTVAEALEPFGDAELIPLPELGERLGVDQAARAYAIGQGVLTPAPVRGPNGRKQVTRDEAELLALAVILGAAAGVAAVSALAVIKAAGLTAASLAAAAPV